MNPQEIHEKIGGFLQELQQTRGLLIPPSRSFPFGCGSGLKSWRGRKRGKFLHRENVDLIRCSNDQVTGKEWDIWYLCFFLWSSVGPIFSSWRYHVLIIYWSSKIFSSIWASTTHGGCSDLVFQGCFQIDFSKDVVIPWTSRIHGKNMWLQVFLWKMRPCWRNLLINTICWHFFINFFW